MKISVYRATSAKGLLCMIGLPLAAASTVSVVKYRSVWGARVS